MGAKNRRSSLCWCKSSPTIAIGQEYYDFHATLLLFKTNPCDKNQTKTFNLFNSSQVRCQSKRPRISHRFKQKSRYGITGKPPARQKNSNNIYILRIRKGEKCLLHQPLSLSIFGFYLFLFCQLRQSKLVSPSYFLFFILFRL